MLAEKGYSFIDGQLCLFSVIHGFYMKKKRTFWKFAHTRGARAASNTKILPFQLLLKFSPFHHASGASVRPIQLRRPLKPTNFKGAARHPWSRIYSARAEKKRTREKAFSSLNWARRVEVRLSAHATMCYHLIFFSHKFCSVLLQLSSFFHKSKQHAVVFHVSCFKLRRRDLFFILNSC